MCRTLVFEWKKRYSGGRISLNDDERTGRPVTKKLLAAVDQVRDLVDQDRRYTLREFSSLTDMSV